MGKFGINGDGLDKQTGGILNRIIYIGVIIAFFSFLCTLLAFLYYKNILCILIGMIAVMAGILIFAVGCICFAYFGWKQNLLHEPNYKVKEMM